MFRRYLVALGLLVLVPLITAAAASRREGATAAGADFDRVIAKHTDDMTKQGRQIFRFDTFGDEDFWGGTLGLHKALIGKGLGGVGPGVSPRTAFAVGLKVDADALSPLEQEQLRIGGRGYDEQDLDATARLADDNSETSFKGTLRLRSISDESGAALYDAVLYLDAGAIFQAGTTVEVGWLSQGGVVLKEPNDALRTALQVAVGPTAVRRKPKAKPRAKAPRAKKPTKKK